MPHVLGDRLAHPRASSLDLGRRSGVRLGPRSSLNRGLSTRVVDDQTDGGGGGARTSRGRFGPGNSGRAPGTVTKATLYRRAIIAATGPTPLDIHLMAMRYHHQEFEALLLKRPNKRKADKDGELDLRLKSWKGELAELLDHAEASAARAAPYVHSRLQPTEVKRAFDPAELERLSDEELQQLIDNLSRLFVGVGIVAAAAEGGGGDTGSGQVIEGSARRTQGPQPH